jgi:voltage-gated potassium channel
MGEHSDAGLRARLGKIIFESTAGAPRHFDLALMAAIVVSVLAVLLNSVPSINARFGEPLRLLEWAFTVLFTLEYFLRLWVTERPWRYARSFYGIVDALSALPTWLSLFIQGTEYMMVVRLLRVLRIFRVLRMARWLEESRLLISALRGAWRKIFVFLLTILTLITIFAALLYVIEGPEHGFTSIPIAMYWAIVTLTTVGYGDLVPQTGLGKAIAACAMIAGYAIIAVPTGIVTVELNQALRQRGGALRRCDRCASPVDRPEARYCWGCGGGL